jgi:O-antigen/teichoic acid export membrane protein
MPVILRLVKRLLKLLKTLIKNSSWLVLLQIINILIPYIVVGTLARKFSLEEFGYIMFCISISHFCFIFTDFGFYISGVDRIAKQKSETGIFQIYDKITNAKIILTLLVLSSFLLFYQTGYLTLNHVAISSISILIVAQAFLPTYYYHGVQKLHVIVLCSAISKILYALIIVFFIDFLNPDYVILMLGLTNAIAALLCLADIYKKRAGKFKMSLSNGLQEMRVSYSFFISRIFAATYTSFGGLLVGYASLQSLAVYSTAEYFLKGLQSVTSPVTQAIFPIMAKGKNIRFFVLSALTILVFLILVAITLYTLREHIYTVLFGDQKLLNDHILMSFIILGIINFLASIVGYPLFASIKRADVANYAIYFGGLVAIIGFLTLYSFDELTSLNVVLIMLTAEFCVFLFRVLSYYFLKYCRGEQ